jgi:hypothetical protein
VYTIRIFKALNKHIIYELKTFEATVIALSMRSLSYKIFYQETLLNEDVVKYCNDFPQNPEVNGEFYKNYITSFLSSNPAIDNDGQQIEYCETFVKEKMYSDMKRYFYSKEYIDNQFLDLLIQYAAKIFSIDFLIIQTISLNTWYCDTYMTRKSVVMNSLRFI